MNTRGAPPEVLAAVAIGQQWRDAETNQVDPEYVKGFPLSRFKEFFESHDTATPIEIAQEWGVGVGYILMAAGQLIRRGLLEMNFSPSTPIGTHESIHRHCYNGDGTVPECRR